MSQYKKDDIKEKIISSASYLFATQGFEGTKISDISQKAGISVGNFYRYYASKDDVFYSIIPENFLHEFRSILYDKIINFNTSSQYSNDLLGSNKEYLEFITINREKVLILLAGSKGTKYENVKAELIDYLIKTAEPNFFWRSDLLFERNMSTSVISMFYDKLIDMIAIILKEAQTDEDIRQLLEIVNSYHMFGITSLIKSQ